MVQLREFSSLYWRIEISSCAFSTPAATASASIAHKDSSNLREDSTESATPCQFIVLIALTYSRETSLLGMLTVSFMLL